MCIGNTYKFLYSKGKVLLPLQAGNCKKVALKKNFSESVKKPQGKGQDAAGTTKKGRKKPEPSHTPVAHPRGRRKK